MNAWHSYRSQQIIRSLCSVSLSRSKSQGLPFLLFLRWLGRNLVLLGDKGNGNIIPWSRLSQSKLQQDSAVIALKGSILNVLSHPISLITWKKVQCYDTEYNLYFSCAYVCFHVWSFSSFKNDYIKVAISRNLVCY